MNHTDVLVNVVGIVYGTVLIAGVFVRSRITEAMRIDALFIRDCSEKTRPLNLLIGVLVVGYAIYSLLSR